MSTPSLLPIKYMDDLHTNLIGQCEEGQFMIMEYIPISDNLDNSSIYVVRFLFQASGEIKNVKHSKLGEDASEEEIQSEKDFLLGELEPYHLSDISVKLFDVQIDGITFGLLYSDQTQSVDLMPGPIITFMSPWDGEYYT